MKHSVMAVIFLTSVLFSAACSKADIDNKDAVRSAMIEYLEATKSSRGIDPNAMDINVDAVIFERDTARATVSFLIKGTTDGMHGNYTLTRQGDKWGNVTRQSITAAPHGFDTTAPAPAGQPSQQPGPKGEPLIPVPLPGAQPGLPPGHPPVDAGAK